MAGTDMGALPGIAIGITVNIFDYSNRPSYVNSFNTTTTRTSRSFNNAPQYFSGPSGSRFNSFGGSLVDNNSADVSMDASESNSDTTSNHSSNDRVSPAHNVAPECHLTTMAMDQDYQSRILGRSQVTDDTDIPPISTRRILNKVSSWISAFIARWIFSARRG